MLDAEFPMFEDLKFSSIQYQASCIVLLRATFGPPPFTVLTITRPMRNKSVMDNTAGLWLWNVEEMNPNKRGPMIADDFPTRL